MSYPQPSSNDYAIRGVQFFRLLTELATPGDIYLSEQSCHALALGPDSDVANVMVAYFDDQAPTFLTTTLVGPPRSFTGRIDARNEATYAPAGRPGRIMFWPADLYDPAFVPSNFVVDQDTLSFITPILDVVQYFKPQQSLIPVRNDKTFRFPQIDTSEGRNTFLILPFWGRKYASCRIDNQSDGSVAWRVTGITYYTNNDHKATETEIDHVDTLANGANHTTLVKASSHGMFDALMLEVNVSEGEGPTPFEVVMSDTPA